MIIDGIDYKIKLHMADGNDGEDNYVSYYEA